MLLGCLLTLLIIFVCIYEYNKPHIATYTTINSNT